MQNNFCTKIVAVKDVALEDWITYSDKYGRVVSILSSGDVVQFKLANNMGYFELELQKDVQISCRMK